MAAEVTEVVGGAGERGDGIERAGSGLDEPTQAYARGGRLDRGKTVVVLLHINSSLQCSSWSQKVLKP